MVPLIARGPSLTLRYPEPRDAQALFHLASDPDVTRWFSWRYERVEDAAAWIAGREATRESGAWLEFVVEHAELGVTGVTALTEPSRRDRRAVTGSWFGKEHWGTGINAESKALLARIAFDACGCERLGSYANIANGRSRRALEKVGFVHEGTLRRYHRHGEQYLDVDVFSLLRDEFEAGPMAQVPATVEGEAPQAFRP